jgi:hypothetical protein
VSDLQHVSALIKAGKRHEARQILIPILKRNRNDEKAWLYMALCAADKEELVASVRNALRINPNSAAAQKLAERYHISLPASSGDLRPANKTGVIDDPDATQASHPTMVLQTTPAVSIPSEFKLPSWMVQPAESAPSPQARPRKWQRTVILTGAAVILTVTLVVILIVTRSGGSEGELTDNARTATGISATNAAILDAQIQTATTIALTLEPAAVTPER